MRRNGTNKKKIAIFFSNSRPIQFILRSKKQVTRVPALLSLPAADVPDGKPQQPVHRRVQGRLGGRGTPSVLNSIPSAVSPNPETRLHAPPRLCRHDSELNCVYSVVAGDLRLHRHKLLRRRGHVSDPPSHYFSSSSSFGNSSVAGRNYHPSCPNLVVPTLELQGGEDQEGTRRPLL